MEFEGISPGAIGVKQTLGALNTALDAAMAAPWWQLSESELAAATSELQRIESRAAAAQVGALGEAMRRGLTGPPAGCDARAGAAWLRGLVPYTPSQALARARLAEALPPSAREGARVDAERPGGEQDHPLAGVRASFDDGAISPGQAGVLVRTATAIDAIPADDSRPGGVDAETKSEVLSVLLGFADRLDVAQMGKAAARARYLLDRDAAARLAQDESAQQEARGAYLVQDSLTGMWHAELSLPPVAGAALHAAIDVLAKPHPAADGQPDRRSAKQRCADAFTCLAERALAARPGDPNGLGSRGGSPVRLIATADLDTLRADVVRRHGAAGAPLGSVQTGEPGGWLISPLTAQVLSCDAETVPILTGPGGRPLDVGATIYPFPPLIRRAIEHRDRHCTYPGCTAKPSRCHAHHLIRHPDGPTSEANGTLLCGPHHRFVHAKGWQGRIVDGHVVWRSPGREDSRAERSPRTAPGPRDAPSPRTAPDRYDDQPVNAPTQEVERALHALARRWYEQNSSTGVGFPDTG